jgi:hypothetical protein
VKIVIVNTINFEPVELPALPAGDAVKVADADIAICVYQDEVGETLTSVLKGDEHVTSLESFHAV